MIYFDLLVDIPSKKRVQKPSGCVYEILQRKGKNSDKDVIKCVGRISPVPNKIYPNDAYFELHPDCSQEHLLEPSFINSNISIGNFLLLNNIARKSFLYDTLYQHFNEHTDLILAISYYSLFNRSSVMQNFDNFVFFNYCGLNYCPSESKISKLFNNVMTKEKIDAFLNDWLSFKLKHLSKSNNTINIDFDSTNFNISSKAFNFAEYGKAKIDEGLPQINVAFFIDRNTGTPLYYDVYYGSIIDMEHFKCAIEKIRSISDSVNACFVMDRGYFSRSNLNFSKQNGCSYLCMGKHTKTFEQLIKSFPIRDITSTKNYVDGDCYGVKVYDKAFVEDEENSYLYLFYDSSRITRELKYLIKENRYISDVIIGKNDSNMLIRNTYKKFLDIRVDEEGFIVEVNIKYDELDRYRDSMGYFWMVSNEDMAVEDVYKTYRQRDLVEKEFTMAKSGCDMVKKYAQSEEAYMAKSLISFICTIIRADIINTMKPYFHQYPSETTQTVIMEMSKVVAQKIRDKYVLRYALTNRQKQILSHYYMDKRNVINLINEINILDL